MTIILFKPAQALPAYGLHPILVSGCMTIAASATVLTVKCVF